LGLESQRSRLLTFPAGYEDFKAKLRNLVLKLQTLV
jgi:hypothetical protein